MIIHFNTYSDMIAWPNPVNGTIGVITSIAKSYIYDSDFSKWLTENDSKVEYVTQNCIDTITEFAPVIQPNSYTTLTNIHSAITSLIIHCAALVDTKYAYIYQCKFTTPATLAITTFSILDADGVEVTWMGSAPSLKANKTYEISVVNGCAVIGVSV